MNDSQVLVIDAGNSNVKLGLFNGCALIGTERFVANPTLSGEEWAVRFAGFLHEREIVAGQLQGCVLSSVTPLSTGAIVAALKGCQIDPILEVAAEVYPNRVLYDDPHKVGADRLCDAAGGFWRARGPVIVVDFGTAVTINAVAANGDFLGGVIAPGAILASKALSDGTGQLPAVLPQFPSKVIGTNTETNLASGLTYGWTALVDGLVQRVEVEMGGMVNVLATGGAGMEYARQSRRIEAYHPYLTLEGAAAIFCSWKARC